jgi:hypothetical protein
MNMQLIKFFLLAGIITISGCDKGDKTAQPEKAPAAKETTAVAPQEKPALSEEVTVTMEATVTAVNHETRQVTLKNTAGESVTFIASDEVRNLAQVDVGDKLMVEYMEAIDIQVMGPEEADLGAGKIAAATRAEPGEKPAGAEISETTVVVAIESIDKENETVTLKGPEGNSKTVKVRNPANLDKVAIGDKVMITYTESLVIVVTEK